MMRRPTSQRRLSAVLSQVAPVPAPAARSGVAEGAPCDPVAALPAPRLLSDAEVASFLARGYLPVLVDDLPPELQPELYSASLAHLPENGGRGLGNNCMV
eukprot:SAG31_NODE_14682_length_793_cov_0.913545_1_plen_100_part_00